MDFTFVPQHYAQKTHQQMVDVLMEPTAKGPAVYYYMLRGGLGQKNITVLEPGMVGTEYIKTYGHYHVGQIDETYQILFGDAIVLLQKVKSASSGGLVADQALDFKAIKLKPGDSIHIPAGFGHVLVNVGTTYLVTADDTEVLFSDKIVPKSSGHTDYEAVKKMQGFAYYVIDHNSQPALKKNSKYKNISKTDFGGLPVID